MNKRIEVKLNKLSKMYPNAWFKAGAEFSLSHENTIWTGEGSYTKDGQSLFNYYAYCDTMGIHPQLAQTLDKLGLYAEFYDAGTVFIYQV